MFKKKLKHFAEEEKSFSFSEGAPFKPFEHTMTSLRKIICLNFFLNIHKNAFDTN